MLSILLLAALAAVPERICLDDAHRVEIVDLGPAGEGGYAEFEVADFTRGTNGAAPVLRLSYACHPDGIGEKGDFWKETAATYLGKDIALPILPANINRYELYAVDRRGRFRAPLLQGLVRYVRFALDTPGAAVTVKGFRLANDRVHSAGERAGSFQCSDERLNGVWEASVRTCELSAIPSYVATNVTPPVTTLPYLADGAKRDRLVWSGDLWWAERNMFFGFRPEAPYMRGSLEMLAANQTPEGYVQASPWPEQPKPKAGEWGPFQSDEFAAWFVPVLADYVLYTGDFDTARRLMPTVTRLMDYLKAHCRADGLFEQRMETSKHASSLAFGSKTTHHRAFMNVLLWKTCVDAARLAGWTGDAAAAKVWEADAAGLAVAIRAAFWDARAGWFRDAIENADAFGWHASALAMAAGFVTEDEAEALKDKFARTGHGKFQALGARGLFEQGFPAQALRLIAEHGWYDVLKPGWEGVRLTSECMHLVRKGWGDEAHPDTAIAGLLSNYILGAEPLEPGWRKFRVRPRPACGITWAKGTVPTPAGEIKISWKLADGRPRVSVAAPAGLEWVADGCVLAERGQASAYAIEVRAKGESAAYAAAELSTYAEKLTGVKIPVGGPAARKIVLADDDVSLGTDGFEISEKDGTLTVRGGKRGILYGVYEILERFGGVGWFSSWHEVVPALDRLEVPSGFFLRELPAFELREPFWFDANSHPEFAARIRKNNALWGKIPEKMGGVCMRQSTKYRGHTFDLLVPPQEFGKLHPEYFSEVKGRRVVSGRTQLCLTNPDVIRLVTERLREQMRKEPEAKLFSLAPNDWYVYCECSNCAAVAKADGTTAGPYVRFVDAVARNLVDEFPDRLVRAGAYQWYRRPPKNFGRYPKNVLCSFAPIECDFAHPIAESPYKENVDTAQDLLGWGKIASGGIRVFDYSTAFWDYPHAFPNLKVLKPNLLFYRRNNVRYVINEGDHTGEGGSLAELKAWVGAKLMWNPDQEVEPLVDRFVRGFYGKAAPQVARYVHELESLPRDPVKEPLVTCGENVFSRTIDDAWLDRMLALWDAAESAVKDDPKCLKNVRLGKFSVAYTILRRRCPKVIATSDLARLEKVRSLARWTVDFMERSPARIAFAESQDRSDGRKTSAFASWKRLADGDAVAPGPAEESVFDFVQRGEWVFLEDDPTASGGKAARIDPKFWAWCLQMKARDVLADAGTTYRFRVRARADFREGAARKGVALCGGFSNRGGAKGKDFQGRIPSARITDRYAWYDLGTWSPTDAADPYFWLSLGQFDRKANAVHPDVTAVWVDQIAFERFQERKHE